MNTASVSGLGGDYNFSAYNAAKGAVVNYTRSMALDHGIDNIRINALCPGLIQTGLSKGLEVLSDEVIQQWYDLVPLGRAGSLEEMSNVVAFLASYESSYITGAMIAADGGVTAKTGQSNILILFT